MKKRGQDIECLCIVSFESILYVNDNHFFSSMFNKLKLLLLSIAFASSVQAQTVQLKNAWYQNSCWSGVPKPKSAKPAPCKDIYRLELQIPGNIAQISFDTLYVKGFGKMSKVQTFNAPDSNATNSWKVELVFVSEDNKPAAKKTKSPMAGGWLGYEVSGRHRHLAIKRFKALLPQ